jgi:hypothetical protein
MNNRSGKPKPAFFIAVLAVVAALGGFAWYRYSRKASDTATTSQKSTDGSQTAAPGPTVEITFEY